MDRHKLIIKQNAEVLPAFYGIYYYYYIPIIIYFQICVHFN